MLDSKGFTKSLKTLALTASQFKEVSQAICLYVIHQAFQRNTNPLHDLLIVLTKDGKGGKFEYATADAVRIFSYLSKHAPCVIRPASREVKFSQKKMDNGLVWLGEDKYAPWYDEEVKTPAEVKEQDGLSVIIAMVSGLHKRVKDGKVRISDASRQSFERVFGKIDTVLSEEKAALSKVQDAKHQNAAPSQQLPKAHSPASAAA